jgi:two-component system, NtrC family, sensor kinase
VSPARCSSARPTCSFPTKEVGKGTGLGLGIVHRIVDAHDGEISLESAPGQGFRVTIDLPRNVSP